MSEVKTILVHICCSVDSHYFLQKLRAEYPQAKLIGFFYDPNIHPYSEYYLRLLDVKRSCRQLGIKLLEGPYDYSSWIESVRGLEDEPEKGARCSVCFDRRFEVSAKWAKEHGATHFTSTLLTSPKKSIAQLKMSGDALAKKFHIGFLAPDYRQKSGTQEQNIIAKESKLYRQNYCGCMFGLAKQRTQQKRLLDELFCPISNQIQPNSIESKIELYEQRGELEKQERAYEIVKERFLNWRLLYGIVKHKKKTLTAHILPYSTLKNNYTRGKIEKRIKNLHYFSRDEVKFITLETYNTLTKSTYTNTLNLIMNPPGYETEIKLRQELTKSIYDLSTIIIVDTIPLGKIEMKIEAKAYEDVQERLVLL